MSLSDSELMKRAIEEARKGGYSVRPNPLVGCAIETAAGEVIVGYHAKRGEAHAERNAILEARRRGINLKGARIAVTLEPCAHTGRTPPCVDLVMEEAWKEILIGLLDPFPLVNGKGIQKLREAGYSVKTGILGEECRSLNRVWLRAHERGRAHLTLKMATSLDGRWTSNSGDSRWITSEMARQHAHEQRERFDAILTSGATVRRDNPAFTARHPDGSLRLRQPQVHVLTHESADFIKGTQLEKHPRGVQVHVRPNLEELLKSLLQEGSFDCLLESGPALATHFLEAHLVDDIHFYMETQILGGKAAAQFETAFNGGRLPGLAFSLKESQILSPTSLFLHLTAQP
jgi:diaminohydroxyphosphoribosylaminopyrimidine deaminase/5-amino-6-(5-phosphoribosylamino)uracil reductase